ncbi:hypothetical protein NKH77_03620 [Streptomyces sp. M19]
MLCRLDDRFQLLVDQEAALAPPGDVLRHSTLRTAIGWSHELCLPKERLLWARLSVFAGDFSLEAAERVCGDEELETAAIGALLDRLVGKSLLVRQPDPDGVRFRQFDSVRAYGAEWLRHLDEEHNQRLRHLAWCQRFADQGERDWFGPGQAAVFHATRREHAQLCAALDFALSTPGWSRRAAGSPERCGSTGSAAGCSGRAATGWTGLCRPPASSPQPRPAQERVGARLHRRPPGRRADGRAGPHPLPGPGAARR